MRHMSLKPLSLLNYIYKLTILLYRCFDGIDYSQSDKRIAQASTGFIAAIGLDKTK